MQNVIAAPISDELAVRTSEYVAKVRKADRPRDHRKIGIELINDLTKAGLEGYFLVSSKEIGLGALVQGAIGIGLSTASRAIAVLVRRFVGKFDDDQLLKTADILERILIEKQTDG